LSFVFFLSGAAALLFETLWFRQAGLALGNGVWAASLVTASFMAGLALGAGVAGRPARIARPLRLYAVLELTVAAMGSGVVWLFPRLWGPVATLSRPLASVPWALDALRAAIAFGAFLVPAAALGATLPILV